MPVNEAAVAELAGWGIVPSGNRPVLSRPPMPRAAKKLMDEVRLLLADEPTAEEIADWAIQKAERYAMYHARPVFDMDGIGPMCSLCAGAWPLCGCHHYASGLDDETGDSNE